MFRAFPVLSASVLLAAECVNLAAAETKVVFDLPATVACRDVTPEGFAESNPGERIFEARLEISIRVSGDEEQIREMTFEFASPERRWLVRDYYPRTTLEAEFAEPICVTKTHETSRTLGASLAAGLPVPLGPVVATVTPGINGSKTGRDIVTETAKKIAPKKAVLVSGTLDSGHGVFFEWKPSTQDTWAGGRVHVIRFVAPNDWQGDWGQLKSRVRIVGAGSMFKKGEETREMVRTVGLYRLGSRRGSLAAERLTTAETGYRKALEAERQASSFSLFGGKPREEGLSADDWQVKLAEARKSIACLSGK